MILPVGVICDVAQHRNSLQRDLKLQCNTLNLQLLQREKRKLIVINLRERKTRPMCVEHKENHPLPLSRTHLFYLSGCIELSCSPWLPCWPAGWVCGGNNPPSQEQRHLLPHMNPTQNTQAFSVTSTMSRHSLAGMILRICHRFISLTSLR